MKQVKYRLWCNNKKEWEKDEWHLTSDGIIIDTKRNIEMKKETHFLNQFTGLFDKQGVEIYEGDILKYEWDGKTKIDCIVFSGGMFTYSKCVRWSLHEDEVIGNIYENPDLLEVSHEN